MNEKQNVDSHKPNSLPIADSESGHRARLLERYIKNGVSSLGDYEILELILTFAIPRRDTKPIAKELITRYGTVSAVLSAPFDELLEFDYMSRRSAALLTLIKDSMSYCLNEACVQRPLITHRSSLEGFLRMKFGHDREERVSAIFLDGDSRVICTEEISRGSVRRCSVNVRTIMDRALKCGAAAFILAHNHPTGAEPSEDDWQTTERLISAGSVLDIRMADHVIITKDRVISMREYDRWPTRYFYPNTVS